MTRSWWWLPLLPALLLALPLLAAWPGYLSFDAAFQFQQALQGRYADIAPPALPMLWHGLLAMGLPATSGPLALTFLLYAFGFGRWVAVLQAQGRPAAAWALALLGPCCPMLLLLLPHVWTDVWLAGALLGASALLAAPRLGAWTHPGLWLLLALAVALRHNALLAVLPLVGAWVLRLGVRPRLAPRLILGALLLALVCAPGWALRSQVEQRLDTWAVTPLFDLQAVSVATGVQRLPAELVGEGMDVDQLRAALHPYSATRLFSGTRSGVTNPTVAPLTTVQAHALLQAWWPLVVEPTWWQHRARLMVGLLGPHHGPHLEGLADHPAREAVAGVAPLADAYPALHARYRQVVEALRPGWWYAPGLYLLLGTLAAALHARGRRPGVPGHAAVLMLSAWIYTLAYAPLAPSAETRYVLWPVLAAWIVLLSAPLRGRTAQRNPSTVAPNRATQP